MMRRSSLPSLKMINAKGRTPLQPTAKAGKLAIARSAASRKCRYDESVDDVATVFVAASKKEEIFCPEFATSAPSCRFLIKGNHTQQRLVGL